MYCPYLKIVYLLLAVFSFTNAFGLYSTCIAFLSGLSKNPRFGPEYKRVPGTLARYRQTDVTVL